MKYWIRKLAIFIVLLYNLFICSDYAGANQLSNIDAQQVNALPAVENLANTDNDLAKSTKENFADLMRLSKE